MKKTKNKEIKETKNKNIKVRCTPSQKDYVDQFAENHNTNTSTLVLSTVMAYIHAEENNATSTSSFTEQVRHNIFRNKMINIININKAIPEDVKEYLFKEIDKI